MKIDRVIWGAANTLLGDDVDIRKYFMENYEDSQDKYDFRAIEIEFDKSVSDKCLPDTWTLINGELYVYLNGPDGEYVDSPDDDDTVADITSKLQSIDKDAIIKKHAL